MLGLAAAGLSLLAGALGLRQEAADTFNHEDLVRANIVACVEPEDPSVLLGDPGKWDELVWDKVDTDSPLRTDGWGNRPWGQTWMPKHMMLGLVHDKAKYPPTPPSHWNAGLDSECFLTDYADESGPDPAGCRVFSKSFAPLKELRNCIVGHLDQDPIWSTRLTAHIVDASSSFDGNYTDWCKQAVWGYVGGGAFPVQLCGPYDSIRRAEEMIKFVLFKPLPDDPAAAASKVRQKTQFTVTWPKKQNSIADSTAKAIQEQCFEVREGQPLRRASFLQRVSGCLPLMYDKAEIQGFGINDGILKFQSEEYYGNPVQNLKERAVFQVPPVCGRLALASIPGFQSSSFSLLTWGSLRNDRKPSFGECLNVESTNCRKAYFCWEAALNRVCGLSPRCCNQDQGPEGAEKTHRSCAENPDGKLVNLGLDARVMPEEIWGGKTTFRGRCPRKLGTGRV
mmetsp:Transcript_70748/g.199788  ORF Transcript_70748/g.199788 Transcript_70748/m.199788 type:complete len:452 (+) Transcript_70748:83-1438(+)